MRGESLRRYALVVGLVMAFAIPSARAAEETDSASQRIADLESYLTDALAEEGRPGLSAAVVIGDEISTITIGQSDDGEPVTEDTVFHLASISKSMTALGIALLDASGDIDLDNPVSTYIPELSPGGDAVTLADIMHHFSGLTQYVGNEPWVGELGTSLEANATRLGPEFSADASWDYSNANYDVLALTVERVSGIPFPDYMTTALFEPLGMENTRVGPTGVESLAQGHYHRLLFGYSPVGIDDRPGLAGSAGVFSTPTDIAHFMMAQLHAGVYQGQQVVPSAAVDTVQTPRSYGIEFDEPQPVEPGYGGGFFVGASFGPEIDPELQALTTLWHEGDGLGFQGVVWMIPEAEIGFVVLTNGQDYANGTWLPQIAQGSKHILFGLEPDRIIPTEDPLLRWGKELLSAVVVAQIALAFAVLPGIRRRRDGLKLRVVDRVWVALATIVDLAAVFALVWIIPTAGAAPLRVMIRAPDYRVIVILMSVGVLWGVVRTLLMFLGRRRGETGATEPVTVTNQ